MSSRHTSGTTQPLDVGRFRPFKQYLNEIVFSAGASREYAVFDVFGPLYMIRDTYKEAFTRVNIVSGFKKAGVWPVSGDLLLSVPRPLCAETASEMMSMEELKSLFEAKRVANASGQCLQPVVLKKGYLDTSRALTLTSAEAMAMIQSQCKAEIAKLHAHQAKEAAACAKKGFEKAAKCAERLEFSNRDLAIRMPLYGGSPVLPCSPPLRRSIAKSVQVNVEWHELGSDSLEKSCPIEMLVYIWK